jgi:vacuolar-type H+-ATPase subunit H
VERFSYGRFAGDASQRVHSIVSAAEAEAGGLLRDAEREAELIRREAQTEGDRIVDEARRRADELVAERMQRLAELSDGIVERSEMLFDRMDAAGHVKHQLDGLLRSLGEVAETVGRESAGRRPAPRSAAQTTRPAHTTRAPAPPPAAPVRPVAPVPAPEPPPLRDPAPVPQVRRPEPVPRDPEPPRVPEPPRRVEDKSDARFDGARLVALQMAVAGSTREEVHEELQRAFRLQDPSSILDDVFGGPRRAGAAS